MFAVRFLEEAGPNTELGWLLYVFLGFFLLMVIVGWLTSGRKTEPVEVPHEVHAHHEEPVAADDLTKLEGIGPKVAKVLKDAGVTTYVALAKVNVADLQKTLNAAGMQMMNPEGWIEQASLAAKGEWTELEKLQSELKGGRRK